ncbi:serine protease FAM111B [Rhinichthys klamathensis goyatoka]|uniref:serine protease FAM111B n=1 Tax=Rhinichthys klamathensis goyatoka TaxID=3034132 RepID=UPI0024B5ADA4|nr:serine protease FAM111B [Rhinichthys klamathensis goyatoka]
MACLFKTEVEEGPLKDPQQRAEEQKHKFWFCFNSTPKPVFVACNKSMTVLDALNKKDTFKMNESVRDKEKEMVIQRSDGAAVKTDFPCSLVDKDEILKITFIKKEKKASTEQQTHEDFPLPRTDLITFKIRTTGGKTVKHIMKNSELANTADYVCVYAFKEEEVETALKRDGRFIDKIFQKLCVLSWEFKGGAEKSQGARYEMSDLAEDLNQKTFQIIAIGDRRPKTQMKLTKTSSVPNLPSAADSEKNDLSQHPTNTKQKTIQERKARSAGPSTEGNATQNTSGNSFFTDFQSILRTVLRDVLNQLNQQKNPQVQELLQKEYDKGVECFTEVNKVRRIMDLSDSVCVIVVENTTGTGFLLFDRFILTNAHVVKDFVYSPLEAPHTHKLSRTLTAVFNHEFLGSETMNLQAKSELIAYRYEKDETVRYHDYALLELEAAPENCTELLSCYKHGPSPNSGGIYIVGHPDCKVKKMDLCFIIGEAIQLQSINKHISENVSCPYVSWQCWPNLYKNRITYDSCFFHGSSGSPVFDEHCNLIGMHTGGFAYKEGEKTRSVIEFSYSMQSIVESIITQVRPRSDIIKLLQNEKFKHIQEHFDLGKIEDAYEANMPIKEEQQIEDEEMDVN